jgi:hypothetical protein
MFEGIKDKVREYAEGEAILSEEQKKDVLDLIDGAKLDTIMQYNMLRGGLISLYGFTIPNYTDLQNYKKIKYPYKVNAVNVVSDTSLCTWKKLKEESKKFSYKTGEPTLVLGDSETIVGKPILISETLQKISLMYKIRTEEDDIIFKFFDDKYDRRIKGEEVGLLAEDFWIYRVIYDAREFFVLSRTTLSNEMCLLKGTRIDVRDLSELTNTLRFKSLTNLFIATDFESFVKTVEPPALVELCKDLSVDEFIEILLYHPKYEKVLRQSPDFEKILLATLLSGKYEGYPLHLFVMGPVGTGKTSFLECLDKNYQEVKGILEAGNSTPKVLIPSFKEKPANPGYILSCFRVALIDELMKMIRNEQMKHESRLEGSLGQLNMLLEQKERTIGSGNNNEMLVKSTAKVIITTNALEPHNNLYQHIGVLDDTTISRVLVWVQDSEHQALIKEQRGGKNISSPHTLRYIGNNNKQYIYICLGGSGNKGSIPSTSDGSNEDSYLFLTVIDSCNSFTIDLNNNATQLAVRKIFRESVRLAKDTMRRVWEARGLHHCLLLLDGIVKTRCLFEDRTADLTPIQKDYDELERLVSHLIRTWDTVLVKSDEDMWKEGL